MAIEAPVLGSPDLSTVATNTNSTPSHPAGIAANDLELLLAGTNSASPSLITNPAGWTQDQQISCTANTVAPSVFGAHRLAIGGESGNQALAHGNGIVSAVVARIRGCDPTTPVKSCTPVDVATGSTSWAMPTVTVSQDGSAVVIVAVGNNNTGTWTPPTGFTELLDGVVTTPTSRAFTVAYKLAVPAGSFAVPNLGLSSTSRGVALVYVLNPAAAASGGSQYAKIGGVYVPTIRLIRSGGAWV